MLDDTIALTSADNFRFWTPVSLRFSDQDPLGHVNNCAYAAFIEAARTMFLGLLLDPEQEPDIDFTLASLKIDYLNEIHYPGTVDVGARILRLGTKSLTSGFGVFLNETCVATSESVNVFFSTTERKSMPMPDHVRARLEADPMMEQLGESYQRAY